MNVIKQEIWRTRQGIYGLWGLEKITSIAFLEVNFLAENPCQGWKIDYFQKGEDHLIQKGENMFIRCLVHGQRPHCWLVVGSFLVWLPKNGEVFGPKAAPEYHKIAICITNHN